MKLTPDRELYHDEHRGIRIEVSRHFRKGGFNPGGVWCFYLHLLVEQFPEALHPNLVQAKKTSDYGSVHQPYAECLEDLDWHSGMTFYEVSHVAGPFRTIKAGCDYDHYWDEGRDYCAEGVMADAKRCVDSLWTSFPALKTAAEIWDAYYKPFNAAMAAKEAEKKV